MSAQPAGAGHVLEIEDRGIGIQPGDLEEINRRLEQSPGVDASLSQRMGLFVVGRLAARYGIKVRLRPSFYGGVTAMVLLPSESRPGPTWSWRRWSSPTPRPWPAPTWATSAGPSSCSAPRSCRWPRSRPIWPSRWA